MSFLSGPPGAVLMLDLSALLRFSGDLGVFE